MLFRCASTMTFILSQLIASSTAVPGASDSFQPLRAQPLKSVELEFGRHYSRAELDNLLQQTPDNDQFTDLTGSKIDETQIKKSDFDVSTVEVESELASKPVYLHKQVLLGYHGSCTIDKNIAGAFVMDVSYNGQHVTYSPKLKTIDKFGYISVGGGRGRPITSTAEFQSERCFYVQSGHMCAYHFFGTASTRVTVFGKDRGVTVRAIQPNELPKEQAGFVTENCIAAWSPADECPPADPKGVRCSLEEIISRPFPLVPLSAQSDDS